MLKPGKYLEVVMKNVNWEYPLDVPDEDELSLGHDDGEYREVVNIMNHMKVLTTKMRRGKPISTPDSVNPGGTPQYYQELLPLFGLRCISKGAVNNHDLLLQLVLNNCETDQGSTREIFSKLKSPTLENIDFTCNNLSNLRPSDMSDLLASNPSLKLLDLRWNPINEQDIVYMADAIRNNTSLRKLLFGFDDPSEFPGNWHLLASTVFDQTSLNSAHDSNHHCHLNLEISGIQTHPISRFNMYEDPILNRRKKIYNILSAWNRKRENAAYFESDNISIKHMPQILALLKPFSKHYLDDEEGKEDDEVEPLSIVYEIMRDWKMPELYNYLDVMEED
eukprot:scaffold48075_cov39-Cyclotella_meneghiniana.AAC.1